MKTYSHSASHAASARADENQPRLRLLALGAVGGLAAFAASPWMVRHWTQTTQYVERFRVYQNGPFAPLPNDALARPLAGLNAH